MLRRHHRNTKHKALVLSPLSAAQIATAVGLLLQRCFTVRESDHFNTMFTNDVDAGLPTCHFGEGGGQFACLSLSISN